MYFTSSTIAFAVLAYGWIAAEATTVQFYTDRNCGSASLVYGNIRCNTCVDPAGDWYAVQFSDNGNQRVSIHNEDRCTSASAVGQWYGNVCGVAGRTALRSAWVACPGQKLDNSTSTDNEEAIPTEMVTETD